MISLKNITVAYGDRIILDDINLEINKGETLAIIGASGSGKSTILRLLIGLQRPTSGQVIIGDTDITQLNEDELNRVRANMGMVFQYSALFDSMSVGENVAFGLRQHTKYDEAMIKAVVAEKLDMVGLTGTEAAMPNNLSGGMKKRVSLARAIAHNPSIMLYDEPTAGLDPIRATTINRLIVSTQKQLRATSVVVTHAMSSAYYVANRIAMLHEGRFLEINSEEEFRNSKNELVQQFIHGWESPADGRGNID